MHKQSLRVLDNSEEMQGAVTKQAMAFAEAMLLAARAERMSRPDFIKEATVDPRKRVIRSR